VDGVEHSQRKKDNQRGGDESRQSEGRQEEGVNDPLTKTETEAPKVPWQGFPE
jgi:hypothetical protein